MGVKSYIFSVSYLIFSLYLISCSNHDSTLLEIEKTIDTSNTSEQNIKQTICLELKQDPIADSIKYLEYSKLQINISSSDEISIDQSVITISGLNDILTPFITEFAPKCLITIGTTVKSPFQTYIEVKETIDRVTISCKRLKSKEFYQKNYDSLSLDQSIFLDKQFRIDMKEVWIE
jgi:hypothetical protein